MDKGGRNRFTGEGARAYADKLREGMERRRLAFTPIDWHSDDTARKGNTVRYGRTTTGGGHSRFLLPEVQPFTKQRGTGSGQSVKMLSMSSRGRGVGTAVSLPEY